MSWSIVAEFAGSRREARIFAKQYGLKYAQNKGTRPNGCPHVSLSGHRIGDLPAALERMAALGWPRWAVAVRR